VLVGGVTIPFAPPAAVWILGGTTTLLIFIGIRNAWDVVTYLTMERMGGQTKGRDITDESTQE